MFRPSWMALLAFAVMITCVVGCGGSGGSDLGTVPVTGTVTMSGAPLEGASVTFFPKSPEGKAAAGITDSEGKFQLTTADPGDGAMPGSYTVGIRKTENAVELPENPTDPTPEQAAAHNEAIRRAMESGGPKELLPVKYRDGATSGFTADVTEGGENNFTYDVQP